MSCFLSSVKIPPPRLPDCKSNVDFPIFKRRILIIVPEVWRMEESLSDLGHDGDVGRGGGVVFDTGSRFM